MKRHLHQWKLLKWWKNTHNKLLRDIREYSEQFSQKVLIQTVEEKTYSCYLVTEKGCEFIANKLTGIKGTAFTAKYINGFHEMEEIIATPIISEQRTLTTDDYIKVASMVASCRNERLPYVLGFLKSGGFSIPEIEGARQNDNSLADALDRLISDKGISLNKLSDLVHIDS